MERVINGSIPGSLDCQDAFTFLGLLVIISFTKEESVLDVPVVHPSLR